MRNASMPLIDIAHTVRKNRLPFSANMGYGHRAPAKSGAGICTPEIIKATQTPEASFFVSGFRTLSDSDNIRALSMVALARQPRGWPVSFVSGSANLVNVTTPIEICTSGGDSLHKGGCQMATTPTQKPQFVWLIAAVRRNGTTINPIIHHIPAVSEREARLALVRDHICFFVGRIRQEAPHA